MIVLTRAQRVALHSLYKRCTLFLGVDKMPYCFPFLVNHRPMTYREFRRLVTPYFDSSGCIMVPHHGTWFGIETDGYTHS